MSVELGIFARIFNRPTAAEVAAAVVGAGFATTQLNLSSIGLPTLPELDAAPDWAGIGETFRRAGARVWGLSATFNMVHPDEARRGAETVRARALITRAPEVGAEVVTLCTGSKDGTDMWRAHPANQSEEAWQDMRATLDELLASAAGTGVRLGIEPEPGNVVSDARRGRRLLDELGPDAEMVAIVLDPANLVEPRTLMDQGRILGEAFASLGPQTAALHAKDVVEGGGYAAAGTGGLDYELIFRLHAQFPKPVPVIVQDAVEDDVPRTRQFLLAKASSAHGDRR